MCRARQSPHLRQLHHAKKQVKKMLATNFFGDLSHLYDMEDAILETTLQSYIDRKKASKVKEDSAKHRKFRQRKSWSRFQYNPTDQQFHCYFRMTHACLDTSVQELRPMLVSTSLRVRRICKSIVLVMLGMMIGFHPR